MVQPQLVSVGLLLIHMAAAHVVFLEQRAATEVLSRGRRANSFLEEMKQGNMERECNEEKCSWEEAREIFEDVGKTNEFWNKYVDGDACESKPCANGGICKDAIGSYSCYCQAEYAGYNCHIVIPQLCENKNGGCEHFCKVLRGSVECSCAGGYYLGSDDKACHSDEPFKCGAIFSGNTRSVFWYERDANVTEEGNATDVNTADNNTDGITDGITDTGINTDNNTDSNTDINTDTNTDGITNTDTDTQSFTDESYDDPVAGDVATERIEEILHVSEMASMTRIVNGEDCPPGQCPWQALLLNGEHRGFCGGTILNDYIILTAAHCMNQSRYIYVTLGEFDTQVTHGNEITRNIETIIAHHRYNPNTYHNDIALIKLSEPIKFSKYILPACLPDPDFAEKVLMKQPDGMVSGFGRLGQNRQASTILQRLTVPYVDRAVCIASTAHRISTRMFCAGYDEIAKDACQGDSGGPHVTRYGDTYFITGIVSWGEGCAQRGKYGVYTQVSKYTRWITDGMKALMSKPKNGRKKRSNGEIKRMVL